MTVTPRPGVLAEVWGHGNTGKHPGWLCRCEAEAGEQAGRADVTDRETALLAAR